VSDVTPRISIPMALFVFALAACAPAGVPSANPSFGASAGGSAVAVSAACSDAMAAAAAIGDISDTVADLEPAIRACETLAEWIAASDANPAALDGAPAKLFAQNACASLEGLAEVPLCVEVGAPGS
jgi:hypothetical protein